MSSLFVKVTRRVNENQYHYYLQRLSTTKKLFALLYLSPIKYQTNAINKNWLNLKMFMLKNQNITIVEEIPVTDDLQQNLYVHTWVKSQQLDAAMFPVPPDIGLVTWAFPARKFSHTFAETPHQTFQTVWTS